MNAFERNIKRLLDCILASCALVILSPVFLCCYIAVKWEDHGPAIFKQERIGRFGKPFYILKFRSMKLDAEKYGPELFQGQGKDPRLTKVGKFEEKDPRYYMLYQIRPGLTSYATLHNGYTDTIEKMVTRLRYDLFYLEHRSWAFDFKILLKTFVYIVSGEKF